MITDAVERYRRDREFAIAEASERQRDQMLWSVEAQSAASARGVAALEDLGVEVSRMVAVADWALPEVVEHLAVTAERLGSVERMLANPMETAAAEFYRRGSYALSSGWLDEAAADLEQAAQLYPYNPHIWFNLGVARQRSLSPSLAADAYARAARYGVSKEPAVVAKAVLIAAALHRTTGHIEASFAILEEYADKLENCAELHLSLGVHHGSHDHLVKALGLAPELVVDARLARVSSLEEAARDVASLADGPVQRRQRLTMIAAELSKTAEAAGLADSITMIVLPDSPDDAVDALLLAQTGISAAAALVYRLTEEIEVEYLRRVGAAENARKNSEHAQVLATAAQDAAQRMSAEARNLAFEMSRSQRLAVVAMNRAKEVTQSLMERESNESHEAPPQAARELGHARSARDAAAQVAELARSAWKQAGEDLKVAVARCEDAYRSNDQAIADVREAEAQARVDVVAAEMRTTRRIERFHKERRPEAYVAQQTRTLEEEERRTRNLADETVARAISESRGAEKELKEALIKEQQLRDLFQRCAREMEQAFANLQQAKAHAKFIAGQPARDAKAAQVRSAKRGARRTQVAREAESARLSAVEALRQLRLLASRVEVASQLESLVPSRTNGLGDTAENAGSSESLIQSIEALLVTAAHQAADKARQNAELASADASESTDLVHAASKVLLAANASSSEARVAATPPDRLIPFHIEHPGAGHGHH